MRTPEVTEGMAENPARLSLTEFFVEHGCTPLQISELTSCGERPGPALCVRHCTVELDGVCQHGCPSVLLMLMQYAYEWEDILGSST
jgi:hypothetical protein